MAATKAAPSPEPPPQPQPSNRKAVYTIIERDRAKARWLRLGIAFVNRDGSMNVVLDAFPANGKLHIRDFSERDDDTPPTSSDAERS